MSGYATEHAGALADIQEAGAAITFTKTVRTPDPTTGVASETTSTVSGHALRVRGKPETYEALSLIESAAPTLLFAPTTYGDLPLRGSTCSWGGKHRTVKDVDPLEPDGTAILARVVVE
jgi:hypothetical protein